MDVAPILLFNEADAIFGIRQEGAQRAVDKMENSLQNILLQEMEKLDGILIATTNLTQNLDKAFERRFLYKVRFEKPSLETKSKIWSSMMPELTESQAEELAREYDFSGGQIENISRKKKIQSIIECCEPDFATLKQYCGEEQLNSEQKRRRIGF
jgi:SpoVK/Ycf46/Vps4 family AAA+-type ATPase